MVLCARALARFAADPPGSRAYRTIIALAVAAGAVFVGYLYGPRQLERQRHRRDIPSGEARVWQGYGPRSVVGWRSVISGRLAATLASFVLGSLHHAIPAPLPAALDRRGRLLHRPRQQRVGARLFLFRGRTRSALGGEAAHEATRPAAWRRTSPSCRSCSDGQRPPDELAL